MATKKSYAPVEIKLVLLVKDVMNASQPIDYDPFEDDIYFTQG